MAENSESINLEENCAELKGVSNIPEQSIKDAKPERIRSLSVKINIDVTDALKSLKAVERQAKKTMRELREVEEITKKE